MRSALKLKLTVGTFTRNHENNLFKSAQIIHRCIKNLRSPTLCIRITRIHPVEIACKQRSLIAACRSTNFHDHVLIIVRVLRHHQDAKMFFQLSRLLGQLLDLHFDHFTHLIVQLLILHHFRISQLFAHGLILIISIVRLLKIGLLFGILS
ncbi:hypothetical protein D3C84_950370 [compost metagenome]